MKGNTLEKNSEQSITIQEPASNAYSIRYRFRAEWIG